MDTKVKLSIIIAVIIIVIIIGWAYYSGKLPTTHPGIVTSSKHIQTQAVSTNGMTSRKTIKNIHKASLYWQQNITNKYEESTDLFQFVQSLRDKVKNKKSEAMALIAIALESCMPLATNPNYLLQIPPHTKIVGINRYRLAIKRYMRRCSRLVSIGGYVSQNKIDQLISQAASMGNDIAIAKILTRASINDTNPNISNLVEGVLRGGNPIAIRELSALVGSGTKLQGSIVNSSAAPYGWVLASCNIGNGCGPGSIAMMQACLNTQVCSKLSYREFIKKYFLSPKQFYSANKIAAKIRLSISDGSVSKLFVSKSGP